MTGVESRVERLHEPDFSEIILKLKCLTELALVGILSMTMTEIWFTAIENYRMSDTMSHGVGWVRGWFEKLWGWVGLGKVLCGFGWVWEKFS